MLVPATFRQQFPEFKDPSIYTDGTIGFWDGIAVARLDPVRWDTLLPYGESLFVAHHLVLAAREQLTAAAGGIAGQAQGILTSKGVDRVNASYDSNSISLRDQGFWGMSSYGMRFLELSRMIGAGGIQLGLPITSGEPDDEGDALP